MLFQAVEWLDRLLSSSMDIFFFKAEFIFTIFYSYNDFSAIKICVIEFIKMLNEERFVAPSTLSV